MAEVRIAVWVRHVAVISNVKRDETNVRVLESSVKLPVIACAGATTRPMSATKATSVANAFFKIFSLSDAARVPRSLTTITARCKPSRQSSAAGQR